MRNEPLPATRKTIQNKYASLKACVMMQTGWNRIEVLPEDIYSLIMLYILPTPRLTGRVVARTVNLEQVEI